MVDTARHVVYDAIDSERDYQDDKWGRVRSGSRTPTAEEPGGSRSVDEFALYVNGYSNKLVQMLSTDGGTGGEEHMAMFRKIAALCVAAMEQHGAPFREKKKEEEAIGVVNITGTINSATIAEPPVWEATVVNNVIPYNHPKCKVRVYGETLADAVKTIREQDQYCTILSISKAK